MQSNKSVNITNDAEILKTKHPIVLDQIMMMMIDDNNNNKQSM